VESAATVVASGGGLEAVVEATDLAEPNRDRLRRLAPDPAMIRRAAAENLRTLALDYGVAHTTLARYFRRPEVAAQLQNARRLARANGHSQRARAQMPSWVRPA
jgi:hypothetical protein